MLITTLYAGLLSLLLVVLILRVVRLRWALSVAIGDGGDRVMMRAIRAHGNFIETAPWGILLLLLMEMNQFPEWGLHLFGATLLLGRLLHAFGLSRSAGPSLGRVSGMILTVLPFLCGGLVCLFQAL